MQGSWTSYSSGPAATDPAVMEFRKRIAEAMQMLQGLGSAQKTQLLQDYQSQLGAGVQDAISRGMAGAGTVLSGIRRGYGRDYQQALGALNESINQQGLGVYGQMSGDLATAVQQSGEFNRTYAQQEREYKRAYAQQERESNRTYAMETARLNASQDAFNRTYAQQERESNRTYAMETARLNASRNAQRRYYSSRTPRASGGFRTVPSQGSPMPGSYGSLQNTRTYRRINR